MQENRPIVLSIAGLDPCAGAGVLADIKTFEQLKVYGMSVITANTIQTEDAFFDIQWHAIDTVLQTIHTLMQRYNIAAVKIGIVPNLAFLHAIVQAVKTNNSNAFIVWDPVLTSSTGFDFFYEADWSEHIGVLQQLDLITPNYNEYQILSTHLDTETNLFIKGGHRTEQVGMDILRIGHFEKQFEPQVDAVFPKHGSGCVLSAAIAAYGSLGYTLIEACSHAKKYIETYLNSHPSLLGYHAQ
mgnify:CR=1 FL=1